MASPNWDQLSIDLSKKIGDAVAAATTSGDTYTSAERDLFLNKAHRRWLLKQVEEQNWNALRGYMNREAKTLSNNVLALSSWTGGVAAILSAFNVTDSLYVRRLPDGYDGVASAGLNIYYTPSTTNQFWKQEGSVFRLLDGGTTTGDSIRLEYIKQHTNLAANDAGGNGDTLVPSQYFDEILDLATAEALSERQQPGDRELSVIKERGVDQPSQVIAGR